MIRVFLICIAGHKSSDKSAGVTRLLFHSMKIFEKLFYDVKYRLRITAAFPIVRSHNPHTQLTPTIFYLLLLSKRFLWFQASLPSEKGKGKKNKTISVSMNNAQETGEVQPRATLFPAFPEGN